MAEMACIEPLIGHGVTINILIGRVTRPSLELGDSDSRSEISFYSQVNYNSVMRDECREERSRANILE